MNKGPYEEWQLRATRRWASMPWQDLDLCMTYQCTVLPRGVARW